jgi:nucleotide-binding universal stress UspA family protein
MLEKILVCLDGSELAEAILPLVTDLAKRLGSKVILLRVLVKPTWFSGLGETVIEPRQSIETSECEVNIDAYLERVARLLWEKGLDVECESIEGPIGESIVTYAKANEVSLIALATHGHGRLKKLALGSIADFVLRKSGIPVISISPVSTSVRHPAV